MILFYAPHHQGNAFDILPGYTKEETVQIYDEMLRALCIPMRIGTHYGATSTNDPTFWLIHPTFDRCVTICVCVCLCVCRSLPLSARPRLSPSFLYIGFPDHV